MKSMTGFGQDSVEAEEFQLDVVVRSVNGRFLEIRPHLPKEYLSFENEIKKTIQGKISRSSVDLVVTRRATSKTKSLDVVVQKELAKKLFDSMTQLKKHLKITDRTTLAHVLRWPEVLRLEQKEQVTSDEKEALMSLLESALERCNEERKREGVSLFNLMKGYLVSLRELTRKMKECAPLNQDEVRATLQQRWKKLEMPGVVDEQRLAQETVIFLDRADFSEEMSRLGEHIMACLKLIDENGPHGKRLEFFSQELLREVNTVGSKSQKSNLTQLVVEAKATIEKLREQVQNIE
ncbi:MAG: YicC/YloC family endoribonuclease [Pseudomonadota bacterium]|nr:YicC/YloC family endoribonuclease [Pseudomonadota bacterium]